MRFFGRRGRRVSPRSGEALHRGYQGREDLGDLEVRKQILFRSGDAQAIIRHAERNADEYVCEHPTGYPVDLEQLRTFSEGVAAIWCSVDEDYTDQDRQMYRAAWFHRLRMNRGC